LGASMNNKIESEDPSSLVSTFNTTMDVLLISKASDNLPFKSSTTVGKVTLVSALEEELVHMVLPYLPSSGIEPMIDPAMFKRSEKPNEVPQPGQVIGKGKRNVQTFKLQLMFVVAAVTLFQLATALTMLKTDELHVIVTET